MVDDSPPSLLAVGNVSLQLAGLQVLRDVSLAVPEGSLVALVGPNGAGKSSLLNCITGLYKPQAGAVALGGRDISSLRVHKRARAGIARAFQHVEIFPTMSVMQNLLLGRDFLMRRGLMSAMWFFGPTLEEELEHRLAVEETMEFFELERHRETPVGSLSFGVQKLVGVARAVASEGSVLLLDEPSSGMNREEKEHLARFMLRLKYERGMSMLWIEHDMEMVMDLADSVVVLDYGQVIAAGDGQTISENQRVVDAFLGVEA